jgi:hypothetical protein
MKRIFVAVKKTTSDGSITPIWDWFVLECGHLASRRRSVAPMPAKMYCGKCSRAWNGSSSISPHPLHCREACVSVTDIEVVERFKLLHEIGRKSPSLNGYRAEMLRSAPQLLRIMLDGLAAKEMQKFNAERKVAGFDPIGTLPTPTFRNLELSARSYNCLSGRRRDHGIADDAPARDVLKIERIKQFKNFGVVCFMEVLKALVDIGIGRDEIAASTFIRNAPLKWKIKACALLQETIAHESSS